LLSSMDYNYNSEIEIFGGDFLEKCIENFNRDYTGTRR
jgi:hypothetical protein